MCPPFETTRSQPAKLQEERGTIAAPGVRDPEPEKGAHELVEGLGSDSAWFRYQFASEAARSRLGAPKRRDRTELQLPDADLRARDDDDGAVVEIRSNFR